MKRDILKTDADWEAFLRPIERRKFTWVERHTLGLIALALFTGWCALVGFTYMIVWLFR